MQLLQWLADQAEERHAAFENCYTMPTIASVMDAIPLDVINGSVKCYQDLIRGNPWYFPTLEEVELESFIIRWNNVHASYFALASEVFSLITQDKTLDSLADPNLLMRVIGSETMRGWVGKRSPSGLDALLDNRVSQLEQLLIHLDDDSVDEILSIGGVYTGYKTRVTAELEIVKLFSEFHNEVGKELELEMLEAQPHNAATLLLRNYCMYSVAEFNQKYRTIRSASSKRSRPGLSADEALNMVENRLNTLNDTTHEEVMRLLDEVKALNYLNLNLEVKYSFKGWAGLMHMLVVASCSRFTGIDTDIYSMHNSLNRTGA